MEDNIFDNNLEEIRSENEPKKVELERLESSWKPLRKKELDRLFELICHSYMAGMSIIEIKRGMGGRSVKNVLRTLGMHGIIVDLPPVSRKRYKLPEDIRYGFERLDFPFEHWCYVNGFDPKEATAALQKDPFDAMPDSWKVIHETASYDIPQAYVDEFQTPLPEYIPGYKRESVKPSILMLWNREKQWYCGSIRENPEIEIYGKNLDTVYSRLKDYCNIQRQANRLEAALNHFESQI